ncbi:hypothetical protein PYW08_010676 [Mythimna loreyi]|uniref:Uncharacterized protein n=1 Tax=Mythimna loreyi TaxID=667449 RepID=A0ACC2Q627_9NEOP|nr:hypothetical protein PYW08_010676 [Mythimna loreyi]
MRLSKQSDPIQEAIGSMGPWQLIITIALSLKSFPAAWNQLAIAVIAPGQDFFCVSPTPMNASDSMLRACSVRVDDSLPEVPCEKFSYDDSGFKSTIVSEWDLVCQRKYLRSLVQPATQAGFLIGYLTFGVMADRIGRKTPVMIAVTVQAVAGLITAFMSRFELFLLFKVISAIATGGSLNTCFTIMIEIVGAETRSKLVYFYHIPNLLSFLSVPVISYLTKTWDGYWLSTSIPAFLLLSYYWLIPESPRWLLAVGKVEQAREILLQAAKKNKKPVEEVATAIESYETKLLASKTQGFEADSKKRTYGVLDLLRTPVMRRRMILIAINYFNGGMIFYGNAQYASRMSKNVRTNLAVVASFELPGLLIAYFLISRISRLKLIIVANFLMGICLLLIIPFYNYDVFKLALVAVGMSCMTVKIITLHLYTGELFPTVVRNIALAICSVLAKLGGIVAPLLIDYVNDIAYWIVPLIFGLAPILNAILFFWLPETKDCKLPDSIKESENL